MNPEQGPVFAPELNIGLIHSALRKFRIGFAAEVFVVLSRRVENFRGFADELVTVVPEHLGEPVIDALNDAFPGECDPRRRIVEDQFELSQRRAQLLFSLLALADVHGSADDAERFAVRIAQNRRGQQAGEQFAVLAPVHDFAHQPVAFERDTAHHFRRFRVVIQQIDGLAQQLFALIAEGALGRRVELDDPAIPVYGDNRGKR